MENSGYGAAHIPSPALVVFSQAAGSLGEALRIQRPFHSQLSDAKELHHLSLVGSYGAHLLHGFPPHLLHPLHPPAVSSASSTFNGGSGAFVKPFPSNFSLPSAFAPPKCLSGIDQKYGFQGMMFGGGGGGGNVNNNNANNNNNNNVPGNNINNNINNNNNNNGSGGGGGGGGTSSESFRTDSSSPACTSLSPPVKEESLEGQTSEEGDRDRICSPPDRSPETPGFRPAPNKTSQGGEPLNLRMENTNGFYPFYRTSMQNAFAKRYLLQQGVAVNNNNQLKKPMIGGTPPPNSCPVCGIQISATDLETHFLSELDRLYKLSSGNERQKIKASLGLAHHNGPNSNNPGAMEMHHHGQSTPDSRWETFQRIRTNRQGRLRAKTRKRRSDSENEYIDINGVIPPSPMAVCQNCPVCHGRLQRTPEEIAQHIEDCLRKSRNQINQQPMNTDEDETVDVESYGDESSNGAMNMTQSSILHSNNNNNNNNNNISKLESPSGLISNHHHHHNNHHSHNHHIIHSSHQSPPNQNNNSNSISNNNREESTISSLSSSSSNSSNTTTLHTPWETTPTRTISAISTTPTISRATPTSSTNQRIDLDYENENDPEAEHDEEVIVDNTDDEDSRTAKRPRTENKVDIKSNSTEEATSSVEIDSATDPNNITKQPQLTTTPDSYVSTSETTEPTSKAQVLEELRARIRELEESPLKGGGGGRHQDEANYKCYI